MSTRPPRSGPARDRTGGGPGRWLAAEAAAALGVTCVTLHVLTAFAGHMDDAWSRVLLLTMAAACVPCVRRLRRTPTRRTWVMTGGMYAAMLAVHLGIGTSWSAPPTMAHAMAGPLTWTDLGMWGGIVLAAVQVVLAAVVLAAGLEGVPPRAVADRVGAVPAVGPSRAP